MNNKRHWYDTYTPQPIGAFAGLQPDVIEAIKKELTEGEEVWWTDQSAKLTEKHVPKNFVFKLSRIAQRLFLVFYWVYILIKDTVMAVKTPF